MRLWLYIKSRVNTLYFLRSTKCVLSNQQTTILAIIGITLRHNFEKIAFCGGWGVGKGNMGKMRKCWAQICLWCWGQISRILQVMINVGLVQQFTFKPPTYFIITITVSMESPGRFCWYNFLPTYIDRVPYFH